MSKLQKSSCPKILAIFENNLAQMFLGCASTKIFEIFQSVENHGRHWAGLVSVKRIYSQNFKKWSCPKTLDRLENNYTKLFLELDFLY